jgi:hypothetical protein
VPPWQLVVSTAQHLLVHQPLGVGVALLVYVSREPTVLAPSSCRQCVSAEHCACVVCVRMRVYACGFLGEGAAAGLWHCRLAFGLPSAQHRSDHLPLGVRLLTGWVGGVGVGGSFGCSTADWLLACQVLRTPAAGDEGACAAPLAQSKIDAAWAPAGSQGCVEPGGGGGCIGVKPVVAAKVVAKQVWPAVMVSKLRSTLQTACRLGRGL